MAGAHSSGGPRQDNPLLRGLAQAGRLFDLYEQLHGEECQGRGLGLALCRKNVELLGGKIWVQSSADRETKFLFTLPLDLEETGGETSAPC
ncbi:MAG: hypothetical protein HY549_08975 [Elusimicrobia bacterium]|nr:hypothetical protein [Elusimicrobiota bacterium]